jgi:hypothetical protein
LLNLVFVVPTALAALVFIYRKKLGGITGDLLGAMTEILRGGFVSGGVRGRRPMIDGHGGNIYQLARRLGMPAIGYQRHERQCESPWPHAGVDCVI